MILKKHNSILLLTIVACWSTHTLEEFPSQRSEDIFESGESTIALTILKERLSIEKAKEEIRVSQGEAALSSVVFPSATFVRETYIIQEVTDEDGCKRLWSTTHDRAEVDKGSPWFSFTSSQIGFEIIEKHFENKELFILCNVHPKFVLLVLRQQEDGWSLVTELPIDNYAPGTVRPVRARLTIVQDENVHMSVWTCNIHNTEKGWDIRGTDGSWIVTPMEDPKRLRPVDFMK